MDPGAQLFDLVPRHRLSGLPFGMEHGSRRGRGSDVASSRPYQVGDDVSSIDWRASARLSSARGADEFIVREHYAEEAPRAVVLCDRRPSMSLYPPELPWLRKPLVLQTAADAIVTSALAAQGNAGYLDYAGVDSLDTEPFWLPPRGSRSAWQIDERLAAEVAFDAPEESLSWAFDYLARFRGRVSFGTFIFVISDFLGPPPREAWLRSLALGWDVVPVIVQDPLWEQSFPELASLTLPLADPATGHVAGIRLSGAEVRRLKAANERRHDELVSELDALGLDWVLLSTHEATAVEWAFVEWAGARRARRVRSV
jgi:uncharacterized protein (DUF58 family)